MADGLNGKTAPEPGLVQRALAGHAAIGLIVCIGLYLVCLTGMLAVPGERWQRWEEPGAPEMHAISPAAAQTALAALLASQGKATTHAYLHLPTDRLPRAVVTTDHGAAYVDAQGRVALPEAHAWTEFMLAMHYYLNLPVFWGMLLTGTLGAMMGALAITGVIAHPRIFRDAFRMRLRGQPQLAQADLHNRFGVWLLPFIVALGLTGAVIGLGQIVFKAIAAERHGGDIEAAYAPIFGPEPKANTAKAPLARVDNALAWMDRHHPGLPLRYVTIEEPGTAGQQIAVLAKPPGRMIYGETYRFDAQGHYLGKVGLSDGPVGQQIAAGVYELHFGTFGGVPVELAWFAFGLALCVICVTGTNLWLMKRAARGRPAPRITAGWAAVVWGSPLLLIVTYWLRIAAGPQAPLIPVFWIGLALTSAIASWRASPATGPILKAALSAAMLATGALHALLAQNRPLPSLVIDGALLIGGMAIAMMVLPAFGQRGRPTGSRQ